MAYFTQSAWKTNDYALKQSTVIQVYYRTTLLHVCVTEGRRDWALEVVGQAQARVKPAAPIDATAEHCNIDSHSRLATMEGREGREAEASPGMFAGPGGLRRRGREGAGWEERSAAQIAAAAERGDDGLCGGLETVEGR